MFTAIALTGLAQAQSPVVLEHRIPATTQVGFSGSALLGADAWSYSTLPEGGGGPAGELRLSGGAEYGFARTEMWAHGSSLTEAWTVPAVVDIQRIELGFRNAAGPGLWSGHRGSVSQRWIESGGGGALVLSGVNFKVGPVYRRGLGQSSVGARATLSLSASPHPRASIWASTGAALYANPELPHAVQARFGTEVNPNFQTKIGITLSNLFTLGDNPTEVLGLPAGASVVTRPELWVRHWLTRTWALQAESGLEIGSGTVSYLRGRALIGLTVTLGQVHAPGMRTPSGEVVLRYVDKDASAVAVAGSFTDWEPLPMTQFDGRWERVVELPPGEHEYVYIVDGTPTVPPEAPARRGDGFGGHNGVLVVEDPTM
jgi:hypothetical protein